MIGLVIAISAVVAGPVELRIGEVVTAPVEEVTVVGVRVGGAESRIIAWDAVRRVTGEGASKAAEFAALSDDAWRARLRLSRGDHALAAPVFERLHETYRTVAGPTALMVAEGTLSCRLAAGRTSEAIEPWLHAVALREAGDTIAGDPPLIPMLDATTMLVPTLPPIWLGPGAVGTFVTSGDIPHSGLAGELGALYQDAARQEQNRAVAIAPPTRDHPGIALVRLIVESRASDPSRRESARFTMLGRLEGDAGSWREAWLRAAIGRSFLMESDPQLRMVGVFHLMHLPARFATSHPELAALALALSSHELGEQGDRGGADALRAELERLFPDSDAVDWLDASAGPGVQVAPGSGVDPVSPTGAGTKDKAP